MLVGCRDIRYTPSRKQGEISDVQTEFSWSHLIADCARFFEDRSFRGCIFFPRRHKAEGPARNPLVVKGARVQFISVVCPGKQAPESGR
jgi:hypothetical protein